MTDHPVVTLDAWLAARRRLLDEEKELTRLRDALSRERRALPWLRIDKDYRFDGPEGQNLALGDLFGGRRQLIVYHFMFAPDWEKPCKSCSFWADGYNGVTAHLEARDTRLVAVSRAPREKLEATAKRMGWTFPWYSSGEGDFNYDFDVSFHPEFMMGEGSVRYNFAAIETEDDRPSRGQRLREGAGRRGLPHLFGLCARPRRAEPRLSAARHHRARPAGGGLAVPDGLGEAARRIRT